MSMELLVDNGRIAVDPAELKLKGFVGEIMWDIAFCTPDTCRDKEAYMELLEHTAKEIIKKSQSKK